MNCFSNYTFLSDKSRQLSAAGLDDRISPKRRQIFIESRIDLLKEHLPEMTVKDHVDRARRVIDYQKRLLVDPAATYSPYIKVRR